MVSEKLPNQNKVEARPLPKKGRLGFGGCIMHCQPSQFRPQADETMIPNEAEILFFRGQHARRNQWTRYPSRQERRGSWLR